MVTQHVGRKLAEIQRKRWMDLLLETANEIGLPADPEFRSALIGYIEWGTRLAVINPQADTIPDTNQPMPTWGWVRPRVPTSPDQALPGRLQILSQQAARDFSIIRDHGSGQVGALLDHDRK
jgi:hemoglobin